jgi:hypothetical protein
MTVEQLVDAYASGALQIFFSIRKTISAGYKNRKLPAAVQKEVDLYNKERLALVEKHKGVLETPDAKEYTFPDPAAFKKDHSELMAQTVDDLPGDRLKLSDLLDGGLREGDYDLLEPFLGE